MLFLEIFVAVKSDSPFYDCRKLIQKTNPTHRGQSRDLPYATLRCRSSRKKYSFTSSASHSPRRASSRIVCAACS